jgi:hypothetical protein
MLNTGLYYPAPSTAPSIGNPLTNEWAVNELQPSYHGSTFLINLSDITFLFPPHTTLVTTYGSGFLLYLSR